MKVKGSEMWRAAVLLLITGCVCASVPEEPADRAAPSDGYCSWITRAQPHGAGGRREGFSEFRLRVEGDPEHYQPGSTYRGTCHYFSCCQDHRRGQRRYTVRALETGALSEKLTSCLYRQHVGASHCLSDSVNWVILIRGSCLSNYNVLSQKSINICLH